MDEAQNLAGWIKYCPETGQFWWRRSRGGRLAGSIAGHNQEMDAGRVYRVIRFNGHLYPAARVAFALMTGAMPHALIDHQNGDTLDNRWANLRPATDQQNAQNSARPSHNKSGAKGVSWDKHTNRWVARIRQPGGAYLNLGRFDLVADAKAAYDFAARQLFGAFARSG